MIYHRRIIEKAVSIGFMSFAKAACVAALTALALAGCSGGGSAEQAAKDFLTAAGNLDSAGICATVSAEMKSGDPAGVSCKAALDQELAQSSDALTGFSKFKGASVGAVKTYGNTGTAVVRIVNGGELQMPLVKENGSWKVNLP